LLVEQEEEEEEEEEDKSNLEKEKSDVDNTHPLPPIHRTILHPIQSQSRDDQPDNIQINHYHVTTILGALIACLVSHVNRLLFCGLVACMPSKCIMRQLNDISWKRIYKQDA
jgi:hypothetical protein